MALDIVGGCLIDYCLIVIYQYKNFQIELIDLMNLVVRVSKWGKV